MKLFNQICSCECFQLFKKEVSPTQHKLRQSNYNQLNPDFPNNSLFFQENQIETSQNFGHINNNSLNHIDIYQDDFHSLPKEDFIQSEYSSFQENLLVNDDDEKTTDHPQTQQDITPSVSLELQNIAANNVEQMYQTSQTDYSDYELIYEEKKLPNKLKLYLKSYMTPEKYRVNIIRSEWTAPSSPRLFIKTMKNTQLQKNLDPNTDTFDLIDQSGDFSIYYLSYKKVMMAKPRDFVYISHTKQLKLDDSELCDGTISIDYDKCTTVDNMTRCQIIQSGTFVKQLDENTSLIKSYSECDFKLNLPLMITKSSTVKEMKKYIESLYNKLKELQEQK